VSQALQREQAVRSKLSALKEKLEKANIPWVVFAGAAAYCFGSKRKVTDIDILVRLEDLNRAKAAIKDIDIKGFDIVADLEIEANQEGCRFFMDDEMIERTKWKQLFDVTVPIIPVEDNIIFKAILQRGEAQGKHDIEDIRHMVTNEKIDLKYLNKKVEKYRAEKRVKPLLKKLRIL